MPDCAGDGPNIDVESSIGDLQRIRTDSTAPPDATSALEPRVAVLLGVDRTWYVPLLFARAVSTAPAVYWAARCAWTLLWVFIDDLYDVGSSSNWDFDHTKMVTEVFLAFLWSASAAYLSYFFADCLMSRWLLNYTPSATLVRLLAINAINAYAVSWVIYLCGATMNSCLLLPAWILIASTLTILYHLTNRSTNIKRETSAAIVVFWFSSFVSMCALIILIHIGHE
ncbi:hypothetical protein NA57DRAFT_71204 [Rhizodiscina lignyota]|uniref:N-glycosylation protein EOS1 n=1 Tax=Rhizodiscina lignyota TaxID=1504668 RepID=A0A9P4MH30_9PEZI|nr:hypothetical protein NA57DRAFT_71204 [Rhizodiscina lignyota]